MLSSPLASLLRQHDPDRYFATLFAPAAARPALFALYAFNHELARAHEAAREPGLALIRLQWWREVVEGEAKPHEVALPLHATLAEGVLAKDDLLAMIGAREREVEAPFDTLAEWRRWLLDGAGSLAVAAGRVLRAPEGELRRLRRLGAGYGVAGVIRNAPYLAARERCLLPEELLRSFKVPRALAIAEPRAERMGGVHQALAFVGRALLAVPQRCDRRWIAAALPAVLGRRDLARPPLRDARPVTDKLAMTVAALRRAA